MNTRFSLKTKTYISSTMRVLTLIVLVVNAVSIPMTSAQAQSPAVKVGFVTDVGGLNDQSGWNALINQGLVQAENDSGVVGTRYEPAAEDDYELLLQQCVNDGNELCIASNFMLDNAIANIALVNPGTNFLIVDMPVGVTLPNLRGVQFDIKQVGYLAGALAGKLGSTMGVVGGMEISPVTGFVDGFRNGAQCSNPDANVLVNYTGTFTDPELGAAVAQSMIAQGANVIFGVGGQTGNGAILYSAQDGKWSIGVDMDQYLTVFDNGNVSGSYNMLTSAMKNLDFAVYQTIQDHINGNFTSGMVTYDLEDGGVALAPYHETDARLTQGTKDYMEYVVKAGILDGSIDINETCREEPPLEPMITFFTGWNGIVTSRWPLEIPIQIMVDDLDALKSPDFSDTAYVTENPDEPGSTRLIYDFPESMIVQPGYTITLDNGQMIRTLVVSSIQITSVDLGTDIVLGTVEPYAEIIVIAENSGAERHVVANASGIWSVDFNIPGNDGGNSEMLHDIVPGDHFRAMVGDDDGDITFAEWSVPNDPSFLVVPYEPHSEPRNIILGSDWVIGTSVNLCIDNPPFDGECDYADSQVVPSDPNGFAGHQFEFIVDPSVFPIIGGQLVQLDNGLHMDQHIVTNLRFRWVDWELETVGGKADPNSEIEVDAIIFPYDGNPPISAFRYTTADGQGNWNVNFAQPGNMPEEQDTLDLDLSIGYVVFTPKQRDENGNFTKFWMQGDPIPGSSARLTDNQVHGYGWLLGSAVTLLVDGNEIGTQSVTLADWDPNQTFVWFDLGESSLTLQAGQEIEMTDGTITKSHTVTSLVVGGVDVDADTVFGTAAPDSQIDIGHIYCDESGCYGYRREIADSSTGEWTANFSVAGEDDDEKDIVDITPGTGSEARQCDEDGDCTQYGWQVAWPPAFGVLLDETNPSIHAGGFQPNAVLTVTIDDPDTPLPDYESTEFLDQDGWLIFNPGYIIQPNNIVTLFDGVTTKSHRVRYFEISSADAETDSISGITEPYLEVTVWTPNGYGMPATTVTADTDGYWSVDFSGAFDLTPGMDGLAEISDADGDGTMAYWRVPNPTFDVRLRENQVHGYDWPLGSEVTLFIDDSEIATQTVTEADWDPNQTFVLFDLGESLTLQNGQFIEMTDGNITKAHTVTNLDVTGIDPDADTIFGTAESGSQINVGISCQDCPGRNEVADGSGNWVADYSVPGDENWEDNTFDIQPGQWGEARQCDEDGECTQYEWNLPNPRMTVFPEFKSVEVSGWPDGATIDVSVDGKPQCETSGVMGYPEWDPSTTYAWINFPEGCDMAAGDFVTVTDGETARTHEVQNLTITEINAETDIITGTADPDTVVYVWPHGFDEFNLQLTADGGVWLADFAAVGYDVQSGTDGGRAEVRDENGNSTAVDWNVPNPILSVRLDDNSVTGYGWPLETDITLTIDDPATTYTTVDYFATGQVAQTPWGEVILFFDLNGVYELKPGDLITLQGGGNTRSHTAFDGLSFKSADVNADTVTGTASVGASIQVNQCDNTGCADRYIEGTTVETWTIDFSVEGPRDDEKILRDLGPGMSGEIWQFDEVGNSTVRRWYILSYTLHAVPSHPEVHGHDWEPGSDVTLIIDDDPYPYDDDPLYSLTKNVDDNPWCGEPCFDLNSIFDLQVGQYTTMTDGDVSKTVRVSVLTVTEVDYVNDILHGQADAGSRVAVNIWSQDGLARYVTTQPDGTWEADFSVFGDEDFEQFTTDINPGDWGRAIQLNPDGSDDGTLEYWNSGSSISGTIYLPDASPIEGVLVEACTSDHFCRTTLTDGSGNFWLGGLWAGTYNITAFPPGTNLPGYLGPINVSYDEDLSGQDITVPEPPLPPPPNAVEPSREGGGTISVFIGDPLALTTYGDPGGAATFEIVVLDDGYIRSGSMYETPVGSGTYTAEIAPLWPHHGAAQITYTITYPGEDPVEIQFFIYIDPSGVVVDTNGMPIENATVTLLYADNPDGIFTEVPDGSVIMSPSNRANPDMTDENGTFGWDVSAGYYKVRVEKDGCVSPYDPSQTFVESDVLKIPPAVTDLELILKCFPTNLVITAPVDPVQLGQTITALASFEDPDANELHTAFWDWGDGSTETIQDAPTTISAFHNYTSTGVYTITLTITDSVGGSVTATYQYVVVYDPDGGFVTGGGWIDSPEEAYTLDPSLTGKATFGFVSKYKQGANVPTGNTEFQFKVANLNFKSKSYDWLVIAGSKAQFKGIGTINGAGEYKFMLSAIDGTPDKFRIKIWDAETGVVVYDNMLNADDTADPSTEIQGGSIVFHKAK